MALRQKAPLPVPYEELVRLQQDLPVQYGSRLWQGNGRHVFVAAVPRDDPDPVNDMEGVVEAAHPKDVQEADSVLLLGRRRLLTVPLSALQTLMQGRVAFDARQCAELRSRLPGTLSHSFYRAPDDPKRLLRLGVRVPGDHVTDLSDADLETLVSQVGPRLEDGTFDEVHCVYLVASEDDLRLRTDPFVQDLLPRWKDEAARRAVEKERADREKAEREEREARRRTVMEDLAARRSERVAYAPVRHEPDEGAGWRRHPSNMDIMDIHLQIDGLDGEAPVVRSRPPGHRDPLPSPRALTKPLDALVALLERNEYEVLRRPAAGIHKLDLAAEREEGYPQRVIAVEHDRLTLPHAEALLEAAKDLDVDVAVAVCDAVDPEAQRRIIATKIRAVRRDEVDHLDV